MRIKGDYSAEQRPVSGSLLQRRQEVTMAGVDTIEYAYGQKRISLWSCDS